MRDHTDAATHMWLCHSDGSRHEDGCDKSAIPERLAEFEAPCATLAELEEATDASDYLSERAVLKRRHLGRLP